MNFKRIAVLFILILISNMAATTSLMKATEKSPRVIIVYMTIDDVPNADVFLFEATLSAFTDNMILVAANQMETVALKQNDIVVFIGHEKGSVPKLLQDALHSFNGQLIAVGYNVEQLASYNQWRFLGTEYIRAIDNEPLPVVIPIIHTIPPKEAHILSTGENLHEQLPFIVKKGRLSYMASATFGSEEKYALSRALYTLLELEPPATHPAYIRLEDISPVSDPKLVKETGDYLADRGIPFYMAVIPVYVNNETGEQMPLSQNKELVQVLKDLQDRGGIMVAHGYTHSYRYAETGEGFEFWDAKLNQPITSEQPDQLPLPLKRSEAFASEKTYQEYKKKMDQIEINYIDHKLTKSIEELTELGLYPIAFEAPHYAASSNGYHTISDYFSSIFGQIQLSDDDWQVMNTPLFISQPALLSGMKLYPETIGYVDPSLSDPFEVMEKSIHRLQTVPGSMIGGFYHPYLGLEYLPRMVQLIESVPNIEWLDLKETDQLIQTEHVIIKQAAGQSLNVSSSITYMDRLLQKEENRPFDLVLWILAIVVALFVLAFSIYVLGLRARLRKRLFEERNERG